MKPPPTPSRPHKRVGVIQSCYIPWRGYFDFIASVDIFVVYDDVQYSSGSWRNRNQVKTPRGLRWLTVPVKYSHGMRIDEVQLGPSPKPWRNTHAELLKESLAGAPNYKDAMALWSEGTAAPDTHLSPLNLRLTRLLCQYLGIQTPLVLSSDYSLHGSKTDRLLQLLTKLGATHYLSGPAAKDYLDDGLFQRDGIVLEYKSYDYEPYPQLWGDFQGTVTVLDLIANTGTDAARYIRSRTPDVEVYRQQS